MKKAQKAKDRHYIDHDHPAAKALAIVDKALSSCLDDIIGAESRGDKAAASRAVTQVDHVHTYLHDQLVADDSAWLDY